MTPDEIIAAMRAERDEANARAQLARAEADGAEMRLRDAADELRALLSRLAAWQNVRDELTGHLVGIVNEARDRSLATIEQRAHDALSLIPKED